MLNVALFNQTGEKVNDLELNESVFGIEPNNQAIFDMVLLQRASLRQGTHKVKNRSAVAGGGKKPWRQKGTGRARQGSTRSPQWVGGGRAFGPKPRKYGFKLNKKVAKLALRSALSQKVIDEELTALDALELANGKTKSMVAVLNAFNNPKKTLLVVDAVDENLVRASGNIPNLKVIEANGLNVYDVLDCSTLMMTEKAIKAVEEVLA